ncbi:MAG: hypothetical protein B6U95_03720 [Thermofilum sp. ex4484_82]|nr:MAG: hypothetical protein B6U95_03720 [Thermofilum sp. ex4484_82]OYT38730.1 MAG: hypothetical protein B6U96_03710 [Archaeoglobales archaeon ex4484_92]
MANKKVSEIKVSNRILKIVYTRTLSISISNGFSAPFFGLFEAYLGASPAELGLFHSMLNLFSNIAQLFWGYLSDKFTKKRLIVFLSTLISSLLLIPIILSGSPLELIFYTSLQAIVGSANQPAWLAIVGSLVAPSYIGVLASNLNLWSEIGVLVSTLMAGLLAEFSPAQNEFILPFVFSLFFGILAAFLILLIPEPKLKAAGAEYSFRNVFKEMVTTPIFSRFTTVSSLYGFFMSIAWPMFTYVIANELGLRMLEVAVLNVSQGIIRTFTQLYTARFIDRYGRKPFIAYGRVALTFFAVTYALFPNFPIILITSMVLSVLVAFLNTAVLAYLIDVTPVESRGSYTALYNLSMGISFSMGSITGGLLAQTLANYISESTAVKIVLLVSAVGRFITGLLHFKIAESKR